MTSGTIKALSELTRKPLPLIDGKTFEAAQENAVAYCPCTICFEREQCQAECKIFSRYVNLEEKKYRKKVFSEKAKMQAWLYGNDE